MPLYKTAQLLLTLLLTGCTANSYQNTGSPEGWLLRYGLNPPTASDALLLCTHFGCDKTRHSQFTDAEITHLTALFNPPAPTPDEERARIAQAIASMETWQGPKLHTHNDLAKNQTGLFSGSNQLDCIAETANTSVYLLLLQNQGLLKYHRTVSPLHRGPLNLLAPHNSAAIQEISSGQIYAVDAWFRDNGHPPWIVEAAQWHRGATPTDQADL